MTASSLARVDSTAVGELVKVMTDDPLVDGIVFDTPSTTKAVVAVIDSGQGPVFRDGTR